MLLISALAFDYDGTLATEGVVHERTLEALRRLKRSGRKLLLVTGRELPDLRRVFACLDIFFDAVVAENGALFHRPELAEAEPLGERPSEALVAGLKRRGVEPLSIGRSIVATSREQAAPVLEAIKEAGLGWQVIFNKSSLMCLPPGVNKASGLLHALRKLDLSPLNVLGAGDAENDEAFLAVCGVSVAVANALPALKRAADIVAPAAEGDGVVWIAEQLLDGPPDALAAKVRRRDLEVGRKAGSAAP